MMNIREMIGLVIALEPAERVFMDFCGLSVAVVAVSVLFTVAAYPFMKKLQRYVSRLNVMTFAVFVAAWLVFFPVYGQWVVWSESNADSNLAMQIILAAQGALRLFLIGIDFDIVLKSTPEGLGQLRELFCTYAACVYIAAPVLTFTNVLSLFRNVIGEIRVRSCRLRRVYVLSELNAQSVAMAKSIPNAYKLFRPMIVFADVFPGDKEEDYELVQQARSLHAICLKRDAANIELARMGRPVEFLLVGSNESENTSQAIALTRKYKDRLRKTSIYTFDSATSTDYILDSLDKGKRLLNAGLARRVRKNPEKVLLDDTWEENKKSLSGGFCLRRIDPVELLVQEVLTWDDYEDYKRIWAAAKETETVSVTILGMGHYGTEFLKTAIWFYQRYGCRTEINVIDLGDANGDAEKRLRQECPELLDGYADRNSTEACYYVRFFNGVDCFSSDFDALLEENRERFLRTQLVFVALGDDERDIRAAMHVRALFDRLYREYGNPYPNLQLKETHNEGNNEKATIRPGTPLIYTVIYDDNRARNLNSNIRLQIEIDGQNGYFSGISKKRTGLINHKKVPYDIRFVGALTERYSYKTIENFKKREAQALRYHLDWVRKESQLHKYYDANESEMDEAEKEQHRAFRAEMDKEKEKPEDSLWWGDEKFYTTDNKTGSKSMNMEQLKETIKQYMCFAYYRKSSLAKEFHKTAMAKMSREDKSTVCKSPVCDCDKCRNTRITEHMRWNAYMRAHGYRYHARRDDRANLHSDLVTWDKLPCREKYKD